MKGFEVDYLLSRSDQLGGCATDQLGIMDILINEMECTGDCDPIPEKQKQAMRRRLLKAKVGDVLTFEWAGVTFTVKVEQHELGWLESLPEFEGW